MENTKGSTKKRGLVWDAIRKEIKIPIGSGAIAGKYRDLMSTYATKRKINARSGEGTCTWKYMDTFDEMVGNNYEIDPPGKPEAGGGLPSMLNDILDGIEGDVEAPNNNNISQENIRETPSKVNKKKRKNDDIEVLTVECLKKLVTSLDKDNEMAARKDEVETRLGTLEKSITQILDILTKK